MRWVWRWAGAATGGWSAPVPSRARWWPSSRPSRRARCARSWTRTRSPLEDELILRRVVTADGRSRAFVNDTPVSGALLRQIGDLLVEVHGQFDQRGLLNPQAHRAILDAFGGLAQPRRAGARGPRRLGVRRAGEVDGLREQLAAARREEEYLRHRERELADLAPQAGEEEELAQRRHALMNREKVVSTLSDALAAVGGDGGALARLGAAERRLERSSGLAPELLEPAVGAVSRALIEAGEAEAVLEAALRSLGEDGGTLDQIEERLFALRDAGRKHRVPVEALPGLLEETRDLLQRIDAGAGDLEAAERAAARGARARSWRRPARLSARPGDRGGDGSPRRSRPSCRRCGSSGRRSASSSKPLPEAAVGCRGRRAGRVRGLHQPGPALRPDRQDRLGRRAVPLHAGAQGGAGAPRCRGDPDLRRDRRRRRRGHRRRGRRAAGAAGGGAPGAGGHPRAADRRSRRSPLQRRQAGGRRADAGRGARAGPGRAPRRGRPDAGRGRGHRRRPRRGRRA